MSDDDFKVRRVTQILREDLLKEWREVFPDQPNPSELELYALWVVGLRLRWHDTHPDQLDDPADDELFKWLIHTRE